MAIPGFGRIEKLGVFLRTGNEVFERRFLSGASIAPSFKNDLVGSMPNPVQGRCPQQFIVESLPPFGEVQVAGDDRCAALIALGDQVVKILILRGFKGFQTEVVDDEQVRLGQGGQFSVIGV